MKRILTILAATLLLTAAMAGTASASSYDSVAEELSAIGVFRGTAGGFELDRAPTRSEAAIMLVRLYGAEDEAKTADFAMLHGLFNLSMLDAAPFLRDDLAAVTYQALGADLKDGSTYLLASLVESGAIDAEAAPGPLPRKSRPTGP